MWSFDFMMILWFHVGCKLWRKFYKFDMYLFFLTLDNDFIISTYFYVGIGTFLLFSRLIYHLCNIYKTVPLDTKFR